MNQTNVDERAVDLAKLTWPARHESGSAILPAAPGIPGADLSIEGMGRISIPRVGESFVIAGSEDQKTSEERSREHEQWEKQERKRLKPLIEKHVQAIKAAVGKDLKALEQHRKAAAAKIAKLNESLEKYGQDLETAQRELERLEAERHSLIKEGKSPNAELLERIRAFRGNISDIRESMAIIGDKALPEESEQLQHAENEIFARIAVGVGNVAAGIQEELNTESIRLISEVEAWPWAVEDIVSSLNIAAARLAGDPLSLPEDVSKYARW